MYRAARRLNKPLGGDASEIFSSIPVQQQHGTIRRLGARLDKRLLAGSVASQLLVGMRKPGKVERISPVNQQQTRLALIARGASYTNAVRMTMTKRTNAGIAWSLNDFAKLFPSGPARFKSQVWRPEILHLTLAFHTVAISWRDPRGFNVMRLLANPEWSLRALASAESLAAFLPRTSNLPKSLGRLRTTQFIRLVPMSEATLEISKPAVGK